MKLDIQLHDERGYFNQKWIKSYFSFSYADYHNHKRPNFGKLLVLNQDFIDPEYGFPARPHKNMEIISIPLEGELHHEDSLGNNLNVKKGSVQTISAGSGISHSEINGLEETPLEILHIWIESKNKTGEPKYQNKKYFKKDRINQWQLLVSGNNSDECNIIHQDAYVSRIQLNTKNPIEYQKKNKSNGVYFFVIEGSMKINSESIGKNDAISVISDNETLEIQGKSPENDILAIEVPMKIKTEH